MRVRKQANPEAATRAWIEALVIGLNLCPFAAAPYRKGKVRFVTTTATREPDLDAIVLDELFYMRDTPAKTIGTTIIILERARPLFSSYLAYADRVEAMIRAVKLEGTVQLATFHPRYCFDGASPRDVANATNRSPYPLLHLLREDEVERARLGFAGIDELPAQNVQRLRALGAKGLSQARPIQRLSRKEK